MKDSLKPFNGGVGRMLALQVSKGFFTLEDLDTPSPGYQAIERDRQASRNPCDWSDPSQKKMHRMADGESYWAFPRPAIEYPPAKPFRNLAREWIAANPKEWETMNGRPVVSVPVAPDPKDFDTVLPPSNAPAQGNKLPITLDEEKSPNPVQEREPLQATEHQGHTNDLETVARPQALPWE